MQEVSAITVAELERMSERMFGDLVKAVVDIARGTVVVDSDLHVDEEQFLLENGSQQEDLWGINLHPADYGTESFIEFDSLINIRPRQNNRSRGVEDASVRDRIRELIDRVVQS